MDKSLLSWLFPDFFPKIYNFLTFTDPLTNSLTFPGFPNEVPVLPCGRPIPS